MNYLKTLTSIFVLIVMVSFTGQAQEEKKQRNAERQRNVQRMQTADIDVKNKELKEFAEVHGQVRKVRQSTRKKMMSAVQEEGLDVKQFSKIRKAKMSKGSKESQADISAEEEKKYERARKKMKKVQRNAQKRIQKEIKATDMSMKRYKEISMAVKQDKELQKKLRNIQQKK